VPFLYPERSAAVVAITLKEANRKKILGRLKEILNAFDLEIDPSAIYLVKDNRILKRSKRTRAGE